MQILRVLEDLELSDGVGISVRSSGCLGNCGSGPNVALDNNVVLRSVGTVASAFKVLKEFCSHEVPEDVKQCIQVWLAKQKTVIQTSNSSSHLLSELHYQAHCFRNHMLYLTQAKSI